MASKQGALESALFSAMVLESPDLRLFPSLLYYSTEGPGVGAIPYDLGPRFGLIPKAPSDGRGNIIFLLAL